MTTTTTTAAGQTLQEATPVAWRAPSSPLSSAPSSSMLSPASDASDSGLSDLSEGELCQLRESLAPRRSYPSPCASSKASSTKASPGPDGMASPPRGSQDGDERPRKKRKLAEPRPRTMQRLDLRSDLAEADRPQLDRLLKTLHSKRKIVVIAGAGISVSAGIPDFRSSTGLFKTLRKEHKRISTGKDLFDASVYQDDMSTSSFHDMVRNLSQQTKRAHPTAFHHLLATLADEGRLLRLYTQNVDGIDTALTPLQTQVPLPKKGPWPKTVQLHGGLDHMVCSKCHAVSDFDGPIFNGPVPPACRHCQENDAVRQVAEKRSHGIGRLRPRMVLYNEHNPDDEAIGACVSADLRTRPDAVIVAGTTLKVPGVRRITREMCATVKHRRDGVNIWINNDPEPIGKDLADMWDLVVQGPCDEVARRAAMRKWDDPMDFREIQDAELPADKPVVMVTTPKKVLKIQGQLTPAQSPRMPALPFKPSTAQERPATPSKKGTKRKSVDAKVDAFEQLRKPAIKVVAKRAQNQSNKKTTTSLAKGKQASKQNTITDSMKVSKSRTGTCVPPKDKAKPATAKNERVSASKTFQLDLPATPRKRDAQVTGIKPQYLLGPISDSDPRRNHIPERPQVEGFTPKKTHDDMPPDEKQLWREHVSRRSSAPEACNRPSSSGSSTSITIQSLLN